MALQMTFSALGLEVTDGYAKITTLRMRNRKDESGARYLEAAVGFYASKTAADAQQGPLKTQVYDIPFASPDNASDVLAYAYEQLHQLAEFSQAADV